MGPQDCVDAMLTQYDRRRRVVDKALRGMEGIVSSPCEGAFYFFPRFKHPMPSREMTGYLADKGILVRSGTEFGENGRGHIRIAFATSVEILEEGMNRLRNALRELG
jgi:aspartate aminotransferase